MRLLAALEAKQTAAEEAERLRLANEAEQKTAAEEAARRVARAARLVELRAALRADRAQRFGGGDGLPRPRLSDEDLAELRDLEAEASALAVQRARRFKMDAPA